MLAADSSDSAGTFSATSYPLSRPSATASRWSSCCASGAGIRRSATPRSRIRRCTRRVSPRASTGNTPGRRSPKRRPAWTKRSASSSRRAATSASSDGAAACPPPPHFSSANKINEKPMKRHNEIVCAFAASIFIAVAFYAGERYMTMNGDLLSGAEAATAANVQLPFRYSFQVDGRLEETGLMDNSSSPYWWVSSGAFLDIKSGVGMTNHGELPIGSKWQIRYAANNPVDTDGGLHPQNIFRMVQRSRWQDIAEEMSFRIDKDNLSASLSRTASNGLHLMSRYADQNNLYIAGLRVDGYAVIKKKMAGKYYTLASKRVILGKKYDRILAPNLLPLGTWIRIKTVTKNLDATRVYINLYSDIGNTGTWTLATEAIDDGQTYGGAAMTAAGHAGLRTDFMDVTFDDFMLTTAQ